MEARTLTRFGWCALLAVLAGGCGTLDRLRPAPLEPAARGRQPDHEPGAELPEAPPPGTVVAVSGQLPPIPVVPAQPAPPMPEPKFPATGLPLNPPRPLPLPMPYPGAPGAIGGSSGFADPNFRATPTVYGGRWELGPNEQPLGRLIEQSRLLDAAVAQNRELLARVRELETLGKTRDQALTEAAREIDALAPAAKDRPALLKQIEDLRGRVKQLEDEDVALFEDILRFLNRQFPPEKKP